MRGTRRASPRPLRAALLAVLFAVPLVFSVATPATPTRADQLGDAQQQQQALQQRIKQQQQALASLKAAEAQLKAALGQTAQQLSAINTNQAQLTDPDRPGHGRPRRRAGRTTRTSSASWPTWTGPWASCRTSSSRAKPRSPQAPSPGRSAVAGLPDATDEPARAAVERRLVHHRPLPGERLPQPGRPGRGAGGRDPAGPGGAAGAPGDDAGGALSDRPVARGRGPAGDPDAGAGGGAQGRQASARPPGRPDQETAGAAARRPTARRPRTRPRRPPSCAASSSPRPTSSTRSTP